MDTTKWVKPLGILFIVLGFMGMMNSFPGFFDSKTAPWAAVILLINAFYALAGLFFLWKKPFAVTTAYIAIAASILGRAATLLLLRSSILGHFDAPAVVFVSMRPAVDLLLAIAVWKVSRGYLQTPDEFVPDSGPKPAEVLRISPQLITALTLGGILCMLIPLSVLGLYFYTANAGQSGEEAEALFHSFFPSFLQGRYDAFYLGVFTSLMGVGLSQTAAKISKRPWRTVNILVLAACIVLFCLNMFPLL